MTFRHLARALLVAALAASGCKKYALDKEVTQTFTTGYAEPLTVNIYQSRDDYANNRNAWKRLTVQAGQPQAVSMEIGRQYWIDWYNADYTLTNWLSETGDIPPEVILSTSEKSGTYNLQSRSGVGIPYARRCLLPGNASSSTWRVAGQFNGPTNPLTPVPFIQITFYKDFHADVAYDQPAGGERQEVRGVVEVSAEPPVASSGPFALANVFFANHNFLATCQYNLFATGFPYREDTFSCDFRAPSGSLLYNCMLVRQ